MGRRTLFEINNQPGNLKQLLCLLVLLYAAPAFATDIDSILAGKQAPAGIVFEIVSDEDDLLHHLLPVVKSDIKKLRDRFPDLPIAIVSHGKELFVLTSENSKNELNTHRLVKDLVQKDNIDVHVCGTHAGWYGVTPDEFPGYVDVSPAGPAQIDDYEEMGYEVIILTD